MENAGRAVADEVTARFGKGSAVAVFGGTGRNGGDGMVAARVLANRGFQVAYVLVGSEGEIRSEDVRKNWTILRNMSTKVKIETAADSTAVVPKSCDILIDAILGTGAKGPLRQPILRAVEVVNQIRCFKIAIDVPTGIDVDTGQVMGSAVKANVTVSLHAPKVGFQKASQYVGEVKVADIGIPEEAELHAGPGDVEIAIVPRPPESHKGRFGRVLVIGGSETFSGAPALVALAALRTGCDLAYVAAPEATAHDIAAYSPNLITIKLKGDYLRVTGLSQLAQYLRTANCVVVGPGLGMMRETANAVKRLWRLLATSGKAAVFDADALKAIGPLRVRAGFPLVVTPHADEFEAISGKKPVAGIRERAEQVRLFAEKTSSIVLLKGHVDVISDGSRVKLNHTGNPGMTVGGTGDVLAGIAASLVAQGVKPFEAAVAGAFVNGVAGDLAARHFGFHLAPTDLLDNIPRVFNDPMILREATD